MVEIATVGNAYGWSVVLVFKFYFKGGMGWILIFHNIFLYMWFVFFIIYTEIASKHFRFAEMLYYKVLESVIEQEQKRLGDTDLSVSK